jgi:prevent-host-death family protein
MAKIIGLKDLRENTESYISQVKKGKSFVVVRRSKPIFKVTPVDEWGDEGMWETVVDFRKFNKNGVPIREVIESLERVNAKDR